MELELDFQLQNAALYCNEALSKQQTAVSLPGIVHCFLLVIRQLLKGHCQKAWNQTGFEFEERCVGSSRFVEANFNIDLLLCVTKWY